MAEPILFPCTTPGPVLVNGVEVQNSELALAGQVAGLADDRVLAELFRFMPTDGTNTAKCIFPAGYFPSSGIAPSIQANVPTVAPTGSPNASVIVNPFRGIVGSRNTPNVQPMGPMTGPSASWRDTRSAVVVGTNALAQSVAFLANSSGNPSMGSSILHDRNRSTEQWCTAPGEVAIDEHRDGTDYLPVLGAKREPRCAGGHAGGNASIAEPSG
jgi:hypothetical protein